MSGTERLCDLLFEVSNEDRLRILTRLEEGPMNVTGLSRELGVTTQEASRHLSRLGDVGLTEKDPEGFHRITPYGELTLVQIQDVGFTSRHRDYFRTHAMSGLPVEFACRMGELNDSTFINDVIVAFYNVDKVLREAEEYLLNINAPYIASTFPLIREAYERGVEGRFIHTRDFAPHPVMEEQYRRERGQMPLNRLSGLLEERLVDSMDLVLYMSEKEVAILAFPVRDGSFDFHGFSSDDSRSHEWCKGLFQYHWERAEPKR
ncbi:ArsR family transcriptional regulator [Candidatus Bathyarchaeota archaeon]|nr:MAG: ArsR family transcriptional regulator [Candidatus Bathyarchaeota archaeon]